RGGAQGDGRGAAEPGEGVAAGLELDRVKGRAAGGAQVVDGVAVGHRRVGAEDEIVARGRQCRCQAAGRYTPDPVLAGAPVVVAALATPDKLGRRQALFQRFQGQAVTRRLLPEGLYLGTEERPQPAGPGEWYHSNSSR